MTELEKRLLEALEKLSTQYEMDMKRLEDQVKSLANQVNLLNERLERLE
jgi:ubiquinone biosynthesis protein UbiJ